MSRMSHIAMAGGRHREERRKAVKYLLLVRFITITAMVAIVTKTQTFYDHHVLVKEQGGFQSQCTASVRIMVDSNIHLLAIDFDKTLLNIHTGGEWEGSTEQLQTHVRNEFKCLIQTSLEQGILVAVASFSKQEELILSVLQKLIPERHYSRVTVNGGNNYPESTGKKKQIQLALEDFPKLSNDKTFVPNDAILLIDDDLYNVKQCTYEGHRCIHFDPKKSAHLVFEQIIAELQS